VAQATKDWIEEAGLDFAADIHVAGPATSLAKFWTLVVQGDEGMADRRASKLLDLLRPATKGGNWRELYCKSPCGRWVQVFAGPDKSQRALATERLTKRAAEALRNQFSNLRIHALKRDGMVTIGWKGAVKITPYADGTFDLLWNKKVLDTLSVDRIAVVAALEGSGSRGSADDGEWIR
jgi:hypothetical protein